ncbi:MAG: CheF family chemotaxis protein, partial [Halanaeroarchaeum sp.]
MTESVVADFTTQVVPDTADYEEPVRGRVIMSHTRVVIVTADSRRTIPISSIFDIAYGRAPTELSQFFEDTVSLAFHSEMGKRVALVEGASETVERFTELLFKAIVNGTRVQVNHPARVGGRITDGGFRPATVTLGSGTVNFAGEETFEVEISTVSFFERRNRQVTGEERPVLSVRHVPQMETVTTEVAVDSDRKMNVLGRFLRTEYTQLQAELRDITLGEEETEALVGLYSGGDDASLASILGISSNRVTMLLNGLIEKGLVEEGSDGVALTNLGKLAVSSRL